MGLDEGISYYYYYSSMISSPMVPFGPYPSKIESLDTNI
jgi:hypothetical protein